MKNINLLKKVLYEQVHQMTSEELYTHILQPEPLIKGLCKYCRPLWGGCPDSVEDDSMCISRFKKWCEMENDKMDIKDKV